MVKKLEAEEMVQVWEAKRALKAFADVLDQTDLEAWETGRIRKFKAAADNDGVGEGIGMKWLLEELERVGKRRRLEGHE